MGAAEETYTSDFVHFRIRTALSVSDIGYGTLLLIRWSVIFLLSFNPNKRLQGKLLETAEQDSDLTLLKLLDAHSSTDLPSTWTHRL